MADERQGSAAPRHLVLHDLLPPEERRAMVDWALGLEQHVHPSTLQAAGSALAGYRNSFSVDEDAPEPGWAPRFRERLLALAPQLIAALGVAPFAVHDIDFDVVIYNDGSCYGPHIDVATGAARSAKADRIITAVYYFHAEPKGFSGGALRLHSFGGGGHVNIEPQQNSLAAFAATTLHEVLPVRCPSGAFRDSRFAVNAWFRRARRG